MAIARYVGNDHIRVGTWLRDDLFPKSLPYQFAWNLQRHYACGPGSYGRERVGKMQGTYLRVGKRMNGVSVVDQKAYLRKDMTSPTL